MSIMSGMGEGVSRRPAATIAIIIVLTLIFTYFGSSFQNNADPESFNPDHELIKASEEAGDTFGTQTYSLLVIAKAEDGNLLGVDDLKELIEFEGVIRSDADVSAAIVPSQTNPTGFSSLASILISAHNILKIREGMNAMLTGFNLSLSGLSSVLGDSLVSNESKAEALSENLTIINTNLAFMQNGNNGMFPKFDKNQALENLTEISALYGPSPVTSFMGTLQSYDPVDEITKTSILVNSIDSLIDAILPYIYLLNGTPLDNVTGAMILTGLDYALPTVQSSAQSLDTAVVGMGFGAMAILTKDYSASGGTIAKGSLVNMNFDVNLDSSERLTLENAVHDLSERHEGNLTYGILGNQLINEEIESTMDISGMVLLALVFVLIVVILFVTFRNGVDTVLTLLSLGMAILWSYGISRILGIQGSIIATVAPILLVGLGVDYGIHMTMRFREEKEKGNKNKKAISIAIGTVGMALLLATVTTGIGFMSNTVSKLTVLKDFAIMVTAGIVASFIIMTTFLPAVKLLSSERRERKKKEKKPKKESDPNNNKKNSKEHAISIVTIGAKAGDRAPWAVIIILVVISSIAGYGAMQLDTVFDFRDFLPRDTEAYDNYVYLIDEFQFGDTEYGEFYLKGDVAEPQVLAAMNQAVLNTQDNKQIVPGIPAQSILSVMQKYASPAAATDYNQSFIENWTVADSNGDGIPESNIKTLYDILYRFEVSHSEVISVLHFNNKTGAYDAALVRVRVASDNLRKADVLEKELEDDARPLAELEESGTLEKVYVIGGPVVFNVVITEMNAGQVNSIIITIVASFIVLTIVFFVLERSFILGFITIIPVILVILWILGTMLLFGYSLNVMTITIASLTVGMGITYSIHVSERFTEDLRKFPTPGAACENTLTHTGMALAGAFLTTAGGFGILYFHKLPPLQQFGVMIALSITYSFLASAYVLPTFLLLWAKWRNRYRARRNQVKETLEDQEPPRDPEEEDMPHDKEQDEHESSQVDTEDGALKVKEGES